MTDLHPATPPQPTILDGRYCRLEPLGPQHAVDLYAAISGVDGDARHRYLFEDEPKTLAEISAWIDTVAGKPDPMFFAVINKQTGRCGGRQAMMRIVPEHGVIEIGSILWGQGIARTQLATEAFYLFATHFFDDLGYRRFEWKCHAENAPSRNAASRFGFTFEGVFRQHMIAKGQNRDTAWFSIIDREWSDLKEIYQTWLAPENFDAEGRALTRLATKRQPPTA